MYRKIAVVGATAAAVVGVGTAALATTGSTSTAGSGSAPTVTTVSTTAPTGGSGAAGHHRRHAVIAALRHGLHAQLTTHGRNGYVVHSAVRGEVTAVSPSSITVKASDGFTETFTLAKGTRVRERVPGQGKGKPGTIGDVRNGHIVAVVGRAPEGSTQPPTATVVIDGVKK